MIPISPATTTRTANERLRISSKLSSTADFLSIGSVCLAGTGGVCGRAKQNESVDERDEPGYPQAVPRSRACPPRRRPAAWRPRRRSTDTRRTTARRRSSRSSPRGGCRGMLRLADVAERDRVGQPHRGHVQVAVEEQQDEERPEALGVRRADAAARPPTRWQNARTFSVREVAVGELPEHERAEDRAEAVDRVDPGPAAARSGAAPAPWPILSAIMGSQMPQT